MAITTYRETGALRGCQGLFSRTLTLTALVSLCALLFTAAPALAAAPEAPEALTPTEVKSKTTTRKA